jgi:bifunctional UDP-N-acetylglucosamine pyrophosphorylase/glucosamine-1-phosphate N-acetyltransferase
MAKINPPNQKVSSSRDLRIAVAIMAAGKGTRLKSKHPKVLHQVGGKPLIAHVIGAAARVVPAKDVYAIIGHEAELVRNAVAHTGIGFVVQDPQRGTGHALMVAREVLAAYDVVIVLSGDAPLISSETIARLRDFHIANQAAMTLLTATLANPAGYGRVIRKTSGSAEVKAIVEQKSTTPAEREIREINSGFYAFSAPALFASIGKLSTANAHGEYYLTDMAGILSKEKARVVAVETSNPHEILGSNTRAELAEIDQHMRSAKCQKLMAEGVTILYPQTCVIDNEVEISADTVVEPFVQLLGHTRIGSDSLIRSYSIIADSEIGDGVTIRPGCILDRAVVRSQAVIGPYSHLRPGSEIGEGAHVGNFVETKKIKLGKGSKANHLSYLGDAAIGEGVNIGAGTITCNYDGKNKFVTIVEDGVFIGSDSTLVAPVTIKRGAYIAAGSCITKDVAEDSLALGRAHQIVKQGWAKAKRDTAKAENKDPQA